MEFLFLFFSLINFILRILNLLQLGTLKIFNWLATGQNKTLLYSFLRLMENMETTDDLKNPRVQRRKQKKLVDIEGIITHNLSNGKFRVRLENGVQVIGHLSGKIRQNRIKIVVGDRVTVELSPYDLTKGRITYRHR